MGGRTRMWGLRRFATRYATPVLLPLASRAPTFGVLTHVGRRSGRTYRTPVNVFRHEDGYVFFLTYGSEAQWVQNVLAAGSCSLETRGRVVRLDRPELVSDPSLAPAPALVRLVERRIAGASEYLTLHAAVG